MKFKIESINSNRGFFSDLVHGILPSIIFLSDRKNYNFCISWQNSLYSDNNLNLFDYFFLGSNCSENFDEVLHLGNCPYGTYFDFYNSHEKLIRGNEVINQINLLNSDFIKKIKLPFSENENVLGVQHRKTDHNIHVNVVDNKQLIKNVELEFIKNSYDKIFLITDSMSSLNDFATHFGDILVYNNCYRSDSDLAIHFNENLPFDRIKIAEEVLIDSIGLSKTNYKMICNSNVSTFSLLANYKKDNYIFIENL